MHIGVEVWMSNWSIEQSSCKVAAGIFVFVAIDDEGNPRALPK
jgi:acyl-CoA hydrolase